MGLDGSQGRVQQDQQRQPLVELWEELFVTACEKYVAVQSKRRWISQELWKEQFTTDKLYPLQFLDSLTNTTARTTQGMSVLPVMSRTKNDQLNHYKTATIALAALCAVMLFTLVVTTMRSRSKSTSKKPHDTPLVVAKQPAESEYQSIRGLPRRETGNSYGYETVRKPNVFINHQLYCLELVQLTNLSRLISGQTQASTNTTISRLPSPTQ